MKGINLDERHQRGAATSNLGTSGLQAADFFNALSDRTVLLDAAGRVTSLSASPVLVAQNAASQTLLRTGLSYLKLCRRAEAAGLAEAGAVAEGVAALLWGLRPEVRLELLHGARRLELQASPLQSDGGAVVVHHDVTAAAARTAELHRLAYSDSLTGLHNRHAFVQEAESRLRRAPPADGAEALIYLDLDGFKHVNDTHGHTVGDAVLKVVATRLQGLLRSDDVLARLGGDEFVLLAQVATETEVQGLVKRIRRTLRQPVVLNGVQLRLEVSVGTALADAETLTTLLERADRAMYAVKRGRR